MTTQSRSMHGRIAWTVVLALALSLGAIATASAKDRNHDRIPDSWEKANKLSLKVNQAKRDQDKDSLSNRGEYQAGDNPHNADTDGDGTPDGEEGAGTITAWDPDTGELTINLFGGDSVTGTVTDTTEVQCAPTAPAGADDPTGDQPTGDQPPADGPPHHGDGHCQQGVPCSADDLAVDEVVQEAHLSATADGLVFDEIKLGAAGSSS